MKFIFTPLDKDSKASLDSELKGNASELNDLFSSKAFNFETKALHLDQQGEEELSLIVSLKVLTVLPGTKDIFSSKVGFEAYLNLYGKKTELVATIKMLSEKNEKLVAKWLEALA